MAGSYHHLLDGKGNFTFEYIENMGDAYEACEDCFKIIKILKMQIKKLKAKARKDGQL